MAFLLEELGTKIGDGIFKSGVDMAGEEINQGILSAAEKIPIIGDGIESVVKDYNIVKDEASGFINKFLGDNDVPQEHAPELMKRFEKNKLHKKLYDDLHYEDAEKIGKQRNIKMRGRKTDEWKLKDLMYDNKNNIKSEMLNDDGTLNLESLEESQQNLLKDRINAENRHGFDLEESRITRNNRQPPKHGGQNYPKFSESEKSDLLGKSTKPEIDPSEIFTEADLAVEDAEGTPEQEDFGFEPSEAELLLDKMWDDSYTSNELLSNLKENNINPEYIKSGFLEELDNAPDTDDLKLKFYEDPNLNVPYRIITNIEELNDTDLEILEEYNKVATEGQKVKSLDSLNFEEIQNDNKIPEVLNKLENDGLKVRKLDTLKKPEFIKYGEQSVKKYNNFRNATRSLSTVPKTAEQLAKEAEQKAFTGKGQKLGETPFKVPQDKPKILSRNPASKGASKSEFPPFKPAELLKEEEPIIDMDKIPQGQGQETTAFSSLDNPPDAFKDLALKIKDSMAGLPESTITKIKEVYKDMTWMDIAKVSVGGGLGVLGYISNQQNAEEIKQSIAQMPKELRDSLGLDLGIFETISSLKPQNTSITGIMDTLTKLYKLSQQIPQNAKNTQDAINIFNQPTNSVINDADNKRKMDKAESKMAKDLINVKKEADKLDKQAKIGKVEQDRLDKDKAIKRENKKILDTQEKLELLRSNNTKQDIKAGEDAKRSNKLMGGDETGDKFYKKPDKAEDKAINISIINDSSVPGSISNNGILKHNPLPELKKGNNFQNVLKKKVVPKKNNSASGILKPVQTVPQGQRKLL